MTDTPRSSYHETPSAGRYADRYYASGELKREPAEDLHESSTLACFKAVAASQVRAARDDTTEAVEITLKLEGARGAAILKQAQPGLIFAFEPKNHGETVDAILRTLKPSAEAVDGRIPVPVHSDRQGTNTAQRLPIRDVLSGLIDISRPTEQLVNLLAERAQQAQQPFPAGVDRQEIAQCYTVAELLEYRPGLLTLEDIYANQPPMKTRPYTISDFDRKAQTVNILVSAVSAKLPSGDPLGLKQHADARIKDGGTATGMLLDIARGNNGAPVSDYPINGYLMTELPRLMYPGIYERSDAVQNLAGKNPRIEQYLKAFDNASSDQTLYFLGTGSGMAPYMAALREMSRRQQADPQHRKPYPGKVVVINGGRYPEDELYAAECRQYVKDGLIDVYHAAASSNGMEKIVRKQGDSLHEETRTGTSDTGRYYIQDVLESSYGKGLDEQIRAGKAMVYVCGTQGALRGVFSKWTEAFRANPVALQHTASVPGRFFEGFWKGRNQVTSHREPLSSDRRSPTNPAAWTKRVLRVVESRDGSDKTSHQDNVRKTAGGGVQR